MQVTIYTVEFDNATVLAAETTVDYWQLIPGDDRPIAIIGIFLSMDDIGDANEKNIRWQIIRGHTSPGSGAEFATVVPRAVNRGMAGQQSFTASGNLDGIASGGTVHKLHTDRFNTRIGIREFLPEEAWWGASQADVHLTVRQLSTVDETKRVSSTLYVAEYS